LPREASKNIKSAIVKAQHHARKHLDSFTKKMDHLKVAQFEGNSDKVEKLKQELLEMQCGF